MTRVQETGKGFRRNAENVGAGHIISHCHDICPDTHEVPSITGQKE